MVRPVWLGLAGMGLLLSAACGSESSNATRQPDETAKAAENTAVTVASAPSADAANSQPPAPPRPDLAGARALIDRIYSRYRDPSKEVDIPFTKELEASIDKQSGDDPTGLGGDPFCQCNDPGDPGQLRHTIQSLDPTADGAAARVSFEIGGPPSTTVTIRMAHREGKWQVADIISDDGSLLKKGQ